MHWKFRYRTAVFTGLVLTVLGGRFLPELAAWPAAASPFVAVAAVLPENVRGIAERFSVGTGIGLAVAALLIVVCLFRRRALCHTVCPLGFCFDLLGKIRKKTTGTNRLPSFFRLGYSSRFETPEAVSGKPCNARRLLRPKATAHTGYGMPRLGLLLAAWTWIGCLLGVVGFLWLDPFVLFASALRPAVPLVFVFLFALGLAWFAPTVWCRCVCPLGGMQDALHAPKAALQRTMPKQTGADATFTQRRRLIRFGLLACVVGGCFELRRRQTRSGAGSAAIRPPGAAAEPYFTALCARCGACVQACPTKLLQPADTQSDWLEQGTPRAVFDPAWCREGCVDCGRACPTGALRRLSPEGKKDAKLGLAEFTFEYCRLDEGIECRLCWRGCPYEAVSYEWSEEEYCRIVRIDPERCTGCGRCIAVCPVKSDAEKRPLRVVPI